MSFSGFIATDFDAYLDNKWSSNVFNLERLQVKQKLEALGRELESRMLAADGSPLAFEVSSEHPTVWNQRRVDCQHLFFSRNHDARRELETIISRGRSMASLVGDPSPLRNHIFLSIMIDAAQVEIALKLHGDASVDRENLLRKSADFLQRENLLQLVHDMPADFSVGFAGGPQMPAPDVTEDGMLQLIRQLASADNWLCFRHSIPRDAAELATPEFVAMADAQLRKLLPLMHHIAWRRDNDFVSIKETLRDKESQQRAKGLKAKDRVRVVRGVFSGKIGVVQDVDAKGAIRVLLGTMVVKLSGEDLTRA